MAALSESDALAQLKPYEGVHLEGGSDIAPVYRAEGSDPKMLWAPASDDRERFRRRAAVRVRVAMTPLEGRLVEPCIYVDWGDGFSEETRKPLILAERGVYVAVAHSNAGSLRALRVDPTTTPCRFELRGFEVEPTGAPSSHTPVISPVRRLARKVLRRLPTPAQRGARALRSLIINDGRSGPTAGRRRLSAVARGAGDPWRLAYTQAFSVAQRVRSPDFAAPPTAPPRRDPEAATVVAFHLPQFHPIPENDAWWGAGFTEWANVSKAVPQFTGHLQPRLPADLGYYDLRLPEALRAQAKLARLSGVDAFCFHFYWFAGRRVLEGPLDAFAADEAIDLPFAISWANENWTRRWDGQDSEVLLSQRHTPEDDRAVFDEMARYFRNPKYLRVGGRPLLVVYRPDILPDAGATVARWRTRARELGLGELFLVCTDAFGFEDYGRFDFDALVEFPPHAIDTGEMTDRVQRLNPAYAGRVYDYEAVVDRKVADLIERTDPRRLPGIMPAWDNEARKPGAGHVFHGATPDGFRRWATAGLDCVRQLAPPGERLLFINAWNEWAEGAYLEPDRWFGHGFAQGLRAALEAGAPRLPADHPLVLASHAPARRHDAVVLLHLFYPELIEEFAADLSRVRDRVDVAVTVPDFWSVEELQALARAMPFARLDMTPNVGRDVAPFLAALKQAERAGYGVFCKLHSKRSPHLPDGDRDRRRLIDELAAPAVVQTALERFEREPRLGLLTSAASRMELGEPGVLHHNRATLEHLARVLDFRFDDRTAFAAGTMFWGRTAAFRSLTSLADGALEFEVEMGRIDGTLAHALERATGAIAKASGHDVRFDL